MNASLTLTPRMHPRTGADGWIYEPQDAPELKAHIRTRVPGFCKVTHDVYVYHIESLRPLRFWYDVGGLQDAIAAVHQFVRFEYSPGDPRRYTARGWERGDRGLMRESDGRLADFVVLSIQSADTITCHAFESGVDFALTLPHDSAILVARETLYEDIDMRERDSLRLRLPGVQSLVFMLERRASCTYTMRAFNVYGREVQTWAHWPLEKVLTTARQYVDTFEQQGKAQRTITQARLAAAENTLYTLAQNHAALPGPEHEISHEIAHAAALLCAALRVGDSRYTREKLQHAISNLTRAARQNNGYTAE